MSHSCTESVRDVQFSPHQAHHFAAVSENGHVQIWDLRYGGKYLHSFTAHSGPIFACDWHPEMMWLATASRDKTIKVDLKLPLQKSFNIFFFAKIQILLPRSGI